MLLEVVGEHSFQWVDLVAIADLLDSVSDLVVEVSWLQDSQGCLGCFVGGQDDISFSAGYGSLGVRLHDDRVGDKGRETIDVGSQFDFDEITLLDGGGLLWHGRVMAADFVDRNASGEGDSLEDLLLVVDLGELLEQEVVSEEADVEDLRADGDLLDDFGEDV